MLIDTFINAIFLYDDKLVLTFNYKEGTKTITFADLQDAINNKSGSDLDCCGAPRRRGLRIVRDDFLFEKVIAHSLRRSSFPTAIRSAGFAVGLCADREVNTSKVFMLSTSEQAACRLLRLLSCGLLSCGVFLSFWSYKNL